MRRLEPRGEDLDLYAKLVQERNKLAQRIHQRKGRQKRQKAREQGFTTNWSGANADRDVDRPKATRREPGTVGPRWQQSTVEIAGAGGQRYKLSPPGDEQIAEDLEHYDEDFEECSTDGDEDPAPLDRVIRLLAHEAGNFKTLRESLQTQLRESVGASAGPLPGRRREKLPAASSWGQRGSGALPAPGSGESWSRPASQQGRPDSGYGRPDSGYGRPDSGYGRPSHGGPDRPASRAKQVDLFAQRPPSAPSSEGAVRLPEVQPPVVTAYPQIRAAPVAPPVPSAPARAAPSGESSGESVSIVERVRQLDADKQIALLRVLDQLELEPLAPLEAESTDESPLIQASPQQQAGAGPLAPLAPPLAPLAPLAPLDRDKGVTEDPPALEELGPVVLLELLSNWGDPAHIGLTQIDLYGLDRQRVFVPQVCVEVLGPVLSGKSTLHRLVDGQRKTLNAQFMWRCKPARDQDGLSKVGVRVRVPGKQRPAALRVWNWNCAETGLQQGVKDARVSVSGAVVWEGQVPMAPGSGAQEFGHWVVLDEQFTVPDSPRGEQLLDEEEAEDDRPSTVPIWLQAAGRRRAPAAGPEEDAPQEQERSASAADFFDSPVARKPWQRVRPPRPDCELQASLASLERFNASTSRRGFGGSPDPRGLGPDAPSPDKPPEVEDDMDELGAPPELDRLDRLLQSPEPGPLLQSLDWDRCPLGSSLVAQDLAEATVVIPELPRGRQLVFNCLSTWGDETFVGLTGIELFDGQGVPVVLRDPLTQVRADPPSINVLPEYTDDPRTADKLFDQVNLTRDDMHVWLAPFTPGRTHTITVDLADRPVDLAMIRVWNYNKSRWSTSRGVRDLEIVLDGQPIFMGEIRQAPGTLAAELCCEHILFTQDEDLLGVIEEHDWLPRCLGDEFPEEEEEPAPPPVPSGKARPFTAARKRGERLPGRSHSAFSGRVLEIELQATWGDPFYVGLTALEVLDEELEPLDVKPHMLSARPSDLGVLGASDPRTLDKLVDRCNCTSDDLHMWLCPFEPHMRTKDGRKNVLQVDFGRPVQIGGLNLWNYNKSVEDTARGVKHVQVRLDGQDRGQFICRRAPGHCRFDFKQVLLLDQPQMPARAPPQPAPTPGGERKGQYEVPLHPCGFTWKFVLNTTWGDPDFVGLNGLSFLDPDGQPCAAPIGVHSHRGSVQCLAGMEEDARVAENLVDGVHDTLDDRHMFLAPFVRPEVVKSLAGDPVSIGNVIEVVFDQPVTVGVIQVWNYAKTPARGCKDVEVYVDERLIYRGILRDVRAAAAFEESILFSDHPRILDQFGPTVFLPSPAECGPMVLFDEGHEVTDVQQLDDEVHRRRPMTAVTRGRLG